MTDELQNRGSLASDNARDDRHRSAPGVFELGAAATDPVSAQTLCRALYDRDVAVDRLPSYADLNFAVTDQATGERFVLKLANADVPVSDLALENAAMRHLSQAKLSVAVPCPMASLDGNDVVAVRDADGSVWHARLLTYLEGRLWSETTPACSEQLYQLGRALAEIDRSFEDFDHEHSHREVSWDIRNAPNARTHLPLIEDENLRNTLTGVMDHFERVTIPALTALPNGLIYNDANDNNLLLDESNRLCGIVDLGDMVHTWRIAELAVAAAYVCVGWEDPVAAVVHMVCGYHTQYPLAEDEIAVLRDLILMRLAQSLCRSARGKQVEPDNSYIPVSEASAQRLLWQLLDMSERLVRYRLREACGWQPMPDANDVVPWLRANRSSFASVVDADLTRCRKLVFDLSASGGTALGGDVQAETETLFATMRRAEASVGVGRYREDRRCYTGPDFIEHGEARSTHIGTDLFVLAGEPIYCPYDAVVHSLADNAASLDYGPTIILEHRPTPGIRFYTLYGHLGRDCLNELSVGDTIRAGERIATVGDIDVNGGWVPHLHFQIVLDMLDTEGNFPGVCRPSQTAVWESLCPDPNLMLGMPESVKASIAWPPRAIRAKRLRHLSPALSLSYRQPLKIVGGEGAYLIDERGRRFLDLVNNVCHVGHCHPRVVAAAQQQIARLNTNTRYLHDNLVDYAERLADLMPPRLSVVFLVNSGSEANDLALRLARTHTHRHDVGVIDHAYHGHLSSLVEISPYKHDGPGGRGRPSFVHKCPFPDPYRGPIRGVGTECGRRYAEQARAVLQRGHERPGGEGLAAFFAESFAGVGGQVIWPPDYLRETFACARDLGAVCIADEVQVGFGRSGDGFWAFETQAAEPDILTLGKPIGNGHPLGAVVTTREIAASFVTGMEYFNTFGGNPVSCAIGLSVLDVVQDERLQDNARETGAYLRAGLQNLQQRHELIGDVRGRGLFIGVELVRDRQTLEPATSEAASLCERLRERGVLLSSDGPFDNVLKIKPPLVFSRPDADLFLNELDNVLKRG